MDSSGSKNSGPKGGKKPSANMPSMTEEKAPHHSKLEKQENGLILQLQGHQTGTTASGEIGGVWVDV
jgi:hypothetical protein